MVMLSSFPPARSAPTTPPDFSLVSAVLEGFAPGVLILAQDGTCLHHNHRGRSLCRLLSATSRSSCAPLNRMDNHSLDGISLSPNPLDPTSLKLPSSLRALAHHLIEGRELFPDHPLVLSQDLPGGAGHGVRVRVQWLDWPATEDAYLVVLLEDVIQATLATARLEALRYSLTPREGEVWVLRQANHSYEAIAQALCISVNTVKRHLKSIYAKRKQVLDGAIP